jgi:hypothetical protein
MRLKILAAAGLAAIALGGCADDRGFGSSADGPTTTTSTVTRDYWGNPVSQTTTVRDAEGNPITTTRRGAPGQPVYSGSSTPPDAVRGETERQRALRAARHPECRATLLHQDRPGGSNYDPARGAPSCIELLDR